MDWTIPMCLDEAKKDNDEEDFDGCLVLFVKKGEEGGDYHTRFLNCGLRLSEAISLMEIVKFDMIRKQRGEI